MSDASLYPECDERARLRIALKVAQVRRNIWALPIGGFLSSAFAALALGAERISLALFLVGMVGMGINAMRLVLIQCPRCRFNLVIGKDGTQNGETPRCLTCGLSLSLSSPSGDAQGSETSHK
jgi:hypothetical protein